MKKLCLAVVGKDVSRSSSPDMHSFIAGALGAEIVYEKVSLPPEEFASRAEELFVRYDGFNVTIPFKRDIIPYLRSLEGDAAVFGAVNTVLSARRAGYNTDGLGFMLMLKNEGVDAAGKRVLLLGAGGAGRSAAKKLKDAGAEVFVYDKNAALARAVAEEFGVEALAQALPAPYDVIVNATGVGMHRTEGISPAGEELVSGCDAAVDLIYVPPKSEFLRIAESLGKRAFNGMPMLFYQAYFAECIYLGIGPDEEQAKELFKAYQKHSYGC